MNRIKPAGAAGSGWRLHTFLRAWRPSSSSQADKHEQGGHTRDRACGRGWGPANPRLI